MPALNFHSRFAPLVESGLKRQTIRATRKRPIRVGDTLFLYTGMRTKHCRRLMVARCSFVAEIRIQKDPDMAHFDPSPIAYPLVYMDGWRGCSALSIAIADGFNSLAEMVSWFHETHGLPFVGQLIRW